MKRAKQVEVAAYSEISQDEYEKLLNHAVNSATWYSTNGLYSEGEILEKLWQKGFPKDEPVYVRPNSNDDEELTEVDLAYEALERVPSYVRRPDSEVAELYIRKAISQGKGEHETRFNLSKRKIQESVIDDAMEEHYLEEGAFEVALRKQQNRDGSLKKDRQKVVRKLLQSGFPMSLIEEGLPY